MTAATSAATLTVRDRAGGLNIGLELDLSSTTPQQVLDHLHAQESLPRATPDGQPLTYKLTLGDTELVFDEPLGRQGVRQGDTITLLRVDIKG